MKNFTTIFLLSLLYSFSILSIANAADIDRVVGEQNRVIQNQQQFEQSKERKTELHTIEIEQQASEAKELEPEEESEEVKMKKRCILVKKITFTKNKILAPEQESELVKNYLMRCLKADDISQMLQEITEYIVKKEYVTSKAMLLKQDVSKGELVVEIVEGKMENFIFNDDKFFDKTQKLAAFGVVERDKILNLRDFASGLEQVNRLRSNSATIKIAAGSYPQSSIVVLKNQPKNTLRTNFALDDFGSESTGKRRDTMGVSYDNLLHLNDNFNFSRTANDFSHKKDLGKNQSLNFGWSMPIKSNLLSISHSRYSYALVQGDITRFKAEGQSITTSLNFESQWIKQKKYRLKSQFGLVRRDIVNYINEDKILSSSRKATLVSLALPNNIFFDKASLLLKPSYVKGVKALNARKDEGNIARQSPHSQFDLLKFYANYSQPLVVPFAKIPFNYNLSFDSQIAKQKLYSSDQFFLGGPYTVRGFEGGSIGGDSGYLFKNELSFNLGKVATSLFKDTKFLPMVALNKISVTPFYDYGYIKLRGTSSSGRLSGSGFRTSFAHKDFTANLTLAWVASKSLLLQNKYSENQAVYFDIAKEFSFF